SVPADCSVSPIRPPPSSPLFPYTTLFRSAGESAAGRGTACRARRRGTAGAARPARLARAARRTPRRTPPRPETGRRRRPRARGRSEEHTSELQSRENLVCRLLLEKKKKEK